jgi:hypothetical protein
MRVLLYRLLNKSLNLKKDITSIKHNSSLVTQMMHACGTLLKDAPYYTNRTTFNNIKSILNPKPAKGGKISPKAGSGSSLGLMRNRSGPFIESQKSKLFVL